MNLIQYLPKIILFSGLISIIYCIYSENYLIGIIILALLIYGLYYIGGKVRSFEVVVKKNISKNRRKAHVAKKQKKFSRKSTPKAPPINDRRNTKTR